METLIKNITDNNGNIVEMKITDNDEHLASCLASLSRNNTFVPGVSRVLYNDPFTKVWFKDGTSVSIRTSKGDSFSKEVGLCYAIIKRIFGVPNEKGEIQSDGYMNRLKKICDSAYDQKAEKTVEKKDEPKVEKKVFEKKPSLAKTVEDLSKTVKSLESLIASIAEKK